MKAVFDQYANQYNQARRKLIPCYDDLYDTAVEIIPFPTEQGIRVLDLGAGTGLFSYSVAKVFKNAEFSMVDIAEEMMAQAAPLFSTVSNKYTCIAADYTDLFLETKFDAVISALSIHHLTEAEKNKLFKDIYSYLVPGGIFINIDQVSGESPEIDKFYREIWLKQVRNNGVSNEDLQGAFERMKMDKMSTLSSQLQWLEEAGFKEINCWYKNYSFVVFSGRNLEY